MKEVLFTGNGFTFFGGKDSHKTDCKNSFAQSGVQVYSCVIVLDFRRCFSHSYAAGIEGMRTKNQTLRLGFLKELKLFLFYSFTMRCCAVSLPQTAFTR